MPLNLYILLLVKFYIKIKGRGLKTSGVCLNLQLSDGNVTGCLARIHIQFSSLPQDDAVKPVRKKNLESSNILNKESELNEVIL